MSSVVTSSKPSIHVRTWSGSQAARITDMANAGKRGKRCRVLRFSGAGWSTSSTLSERQNEAANATREILGFVERLDPSASFDEVAGTIAGMIDLARKAHDLPEAWLTCCADEIRGVDAPRPVLTAGVAGKWSASADENGITVNDEVDQNNLPCMITPSGQQSSRAYDLAAKVWDRVRSAASFSEVGEILGAAGCKLHYYCRMD